MASPIMRRSSSICFSPGPPRTPAPPVWRSRFDLQLAFVAAGALREDFKDEQGAVVHRTVEMTLQVALLGRAERLVEQHFGGAGLFRQGLDLVGLALADEQGRVGRPALAHDPSDRGQSGRFGQLSQFFQAGVEMRQPQVDPYQDGGCAGAFGQFGKTQVGNLGAGSGFTSRRTGKRARGRQLALASPLSAVLKLTARPGTIVEIACL
jgi:hypothetical protein